MDRNISNLVFSVYCIRVYKLLSKVRQIYFNIDEKNNFCNIITNKKKMLKILDFKDKKS